MFCSFFRFTMSSAADSGQPLGPMTRRHVLTCDECRQFHRTCRVLGEALQSEAAALAGASGGLTGQILAGLPRAQQHRPARPLWTAVAAAACVAVAAWIAYVGPRAEAPAPPAPPTYAFAIPPLELTTTWSRVFEAPLLTEAQNLSSSAQSGIRFLVACLAIMPPETVTSPQLDESVPPSVQ
jgi:hypothetical protein